MGRESLAFGGASDVVDDIDRTMVGGGGGGNEVGWETDGAIFGGGGGRVPRDDGRTPPVVAGVVVEEEKSEDMPEVIPILEVILERLKFADGGALERPGIGRLV